ncbi:MAG: hypothetical protein CVU97_00445 [Firmicutes bacterium HGW-Firmicutes-21]|nr:MAG: hypothetical protein CVU97_00445 [Firmicutes bacterium HGW-Firmicutes-21]
MVTIDIINRLIESGGIRTEFSCEAAEQARIAANMRITAHSRSRLDLRGKTVFTFNSMPIESTAFSGSSIQKTDCAYSLDRKRGMFRLGLHIADTSEYVSESSPLDIEAKTRGVSINIPGRSIPMLHEGLSKGACFFKEGEDKLAVSIFLDIDEKGSLLDISFEESVIRTARNCIFSEIDTLYTSTDSSSVLPLREKYAVLLPNMNDMYELGGILYSSRMASENTEYIELKRHYSFDTSGEITSCELKTDYDSKLLVREFLIFTGRVLAKYMQRNSVPCIYANQPVLSKEHLSIMADILNLSVTDEISDVEKQKLIFDTAKLTPGTDIINILASRELPTMDYSVLPQPHSLFMEPLVRFSSPTSRYSDLAVQRVIKEFMKARGNTNALNLTRLKKNVSEAAQITRDAEAKAAKLHCEVSDLLSLRIMQKRPTDGYPAYITSLNNGEMSILLENGIKGRIYPKSECKKELYSVGERIEVEPFDLSGGTENALFSIKAIKG